MMRWTVVVAYYNEAEYLPHMLASIAEQTLRPFRLVLIDNGSTDGSPAIAQAATDAMEGVEAIHLSEAQPGKIHALAAAMAHLSTDFAAFTDADTFYPPDYLAAATRAFDADDDVVAAMAVDLPDTPDTAAGKRKIAHVQIVSRLWPRQTHTGGYGQNFRTAALVAAGGWSAAFWPYVLMDHEIMQRVLKLGRQVYPRDLWCIPSARRSDRRRVRWTVPERLIYHFSPWATRDWYFYRFLAKRLERRKLGHLNLREKTWETRAR